MTANWQSRPFEQCIEPVVYTAKVQRKDFLADGPYPVVSQEEAFVNGFWDQEADIFRVERPLVVFGDHTRALKYIDFDFVLGADGVKVLKPKPFLHPRFFYYQLHTAKLDSLGYARHYRLLKEHHVAYPAYAEQQRIAAILDEAFEGIATAKANAEKNLQNAGELFESRVKSTFANSADGWVKCALGSVCEMYQPKTITGKDLVADGPYPVFGANGVIGRYTAYNHEEAEVLVTCRGATCGAINVSEPRSWVTGNAMVVRPLDGSLDKSFLEHLLRSVVDLSPAITGAAQPQITRTNLSPLMISFPSSVNEQRNLTAAFDELQATVDSLQDVYSRKLAALDELKKSLLQQAFTGALTAKSTDKQLEAVA